MSLLKRPRGALDGKERPTPSIEWCRYLRPASPTSPTPSPSEFNPWAPEIKTASIASFSWRLPLKRKEEFFFLSEIKVSESLSISPVITNFCVGSKTAQILLWMTFHKCSLSVQRGNYPDQQKAMNALLLDGPQKGKSFAQQNRRLFGITLTVNVTI